MKERKHMVFLLVLVFSFGCGEDEDKGPGEQGSVQKDKGVSDTGAAGTAACVDFCKKCPDGQVIKPGANCKSFCEVFREATELAGCLDKWKKDWTCYMSDKTCPKTGKSSCTYEFEDCTENFCRAPENKDKCAKIYAKYKP